MFLDEPLFVQSGASYLVLGHGCFIRILVPGASKISVSWTPGQQAWTAPVALQSFARQVQNRADTVPQLDVKAQAEWATKGEKPVANMGLHDKSKDQQLCACQVIR